jgi:hypothetical protein
MHVVERPVEANEASLGGEGRGSARTLGLGGRAASVQTGRKGLSNTVTDNGRDETS